MSEHGDTYRVYLDGGVGQDLHEASPRDRELTETRDVPFCLGIVGAFSGPWSVGAEEDLHAASRRPLRRVTPENVVNLAGLTPAIGLADSDAEELRFSGLEDFHPDNLVTRQKLFRALWEARTAIKEGEPPTPEAAGNVHDLGSGEGGRSGGGGRAEPRSGSGEGEGPRDSGHGDGPRGTESGSDLLNAVLGQTGGPAGKSAGPRSRDAAETDLDEDLDDFVRRAVDPHRVKEEPERETRLEELDSRIARLLLEVLHDPGFMELESLWRSVVFLLSRIPVSTRLRVYLIDVSEAELMGDLLSSDDPAEWGFAHTMLNPMSEDGEALRWAALVGTYRFGSDPLHVPLLQRLGLLAENARVPWISGADPSLLGCSGPLSASPDPREWTDTVDPLWEELREKPEAKWIHLALPGFLLRPPYGPDGARAKRVAVQEDPAFPHDLLWGNPGVLMGLVLAQRFATSGWGMVPSGRLQIQDLPMTQDPEGHMTCLEARLSQSGAGEVRERGLNPVLSPRNEPRAFLEGLRSISTSGEGLNAWWIS